LCLFSVVARSPCGEWLLPLCQAADVLRVALSASSEVRFLGFFQQCFLSESVKDRLGLTLMLVHSEQSVRCSFFPYIACSSKKQNAVDAPCSDIRFWDGQVTVVQTLCYSSLNKA